MEKQFGNAVRPTSAIVHQMRCYELIQEFRHKLVEYSLKYAHQCENGEEVEWFRNRFLETWAETVHTAEGTFGKKTVDRVLENLNLTRDA